MVSTAPTKQTAHILPQNSQNPQKPLAEISSHRWHRCAQIFLAEIFSHGLHRTRRILVPSLYNCRRVWHPCHTHAALCQSSHGIHRIHRNFWRRRVSHRFHRCSQMVRLLRLLCGDSLVAAWVWQGCHTLLSVHSVGEHAPPGGGKKNKEGMAECHALLR